MRKATVLIALALLVLPGFAQSRNCLRLMSADEFRRATGRRLGWNVVLSGSFTLTRQGEQLIFHGRGFGSQVGLCLAGALAQALKGRRYEEILHFYF
ncbi:MAG TPA: hypothetical protein VIS78_11080, partial [Blastocatellia bacterium]